MRIIGVVIVLAGCMTAEPTAVEQSSQQIAGTCEANEIACGSEAMVDISGHTERAFGAGPSEKEAEQSCKRQAAWEQGFKVGRCKLCSDTGQRCAIHPATTGSQGLSTTLSMICLDVTNDAQTPFPWWGCACSIQFHDFQVAMECESCADGSGRCDGDSDGDPVEN